MQVMIVVRSDTLQVKVPGSKPGHIGGILFEEDVVRPEWILGVLRSTEVEGFEPSHWMENVKKVIRSVGTGASTVYERFDDVEVIVMHARCLKNLGPLNLKPVDVPYRFRVHSYSGRSVAESTVVF